MTTTTIDESKLEAFLGQVIGDGGAALSVLLTHLGDKLGLYAAMADGEPVTAAGIDRGAGQRLPGFGVHRLRLPRAVRAGGA